MMSGQVNSSRFPRVIKARTSSSILTGTRITTVFSPNLGKSKPKKDGEKIDLTRAGWSPSIIIGADCSVPALGVV
jgi:hypothetical protein